MPPTAGNLLTRLFKAVIPDKKEDIPGRDPQRLEELMQGGLFMHALKSARVKLISSLYAKL